MYALHCTALHCIANICMSGPLLPFCPHHWVAALMVMHTTPCCSLFWVAINSALTHTAHCALHTKMQGDSCNYPRAQIAASGQKVTINARMRMHHYIAPESALLNNKISKRSVFCWFWLKTNSRVKFGRVIDSCAGAPLFSLTVSWLQGSLSHCNCNCTDCQWQCNALRNYTSLHAVQQNHLPCNTLVSLIAHWEAHQACWLQFSCDPMQQPWLSFTPLHLSTASQTVIRLSATVLIGRCSVPPCASACVQWWWPWLYYHTHAPWIDSSPLLAPLHCVAIYKTE